MNPKKTVHVALNKVWKNGKKVKFNSTIDSVDKEVMMSDYNVFLCITTNHTSSSQDQASGIIANYVAGLKFSLGDSTIPRMREQDQL
jgi:hypothetical protein